MSNKKNQLSENVAAIIAIGFLLFAFSVNIMILTRNVKASDTIVSTILSNVTNIMMLIVGYYYGSSQGSKNKQEALNRPTGNIENASNVTVNEK